MNLTPDEQANLIRMGLEAKAKAQAHDVRDRMTRLIPDLASRSLTPITFHARIADLIEQLTILDYDIQVLWDVKIETGLEMNDTVLESHHDDTVPDGAAAPRTRTPDRD